MNAFLRLSLLSLVVVFLAGCSSIVGTWQSTSIHVPEFSDVKSTEVTFTKDGQTTSTWVHADGHTDVREATYTVKGNKINFYKDGQFLYDLWYSMSGERLTLGSEKGHIVYVRED